MSAAPPLSDALRSALRGQVHRLVGGGDAEAVTTRSPGDAGLLGADSAAREVHGDFTTMMAGGVAALLLQMLHPAALAGVWDHSDFRRDMSGRLRRTARFISVTTYGSTAEAERLIGRVRAIHGHVQGTLPDGTPYSADDPALLGWVHVAEASMFLASYMRYRAPGFARADQDRYFAEMAIVARRLGASDIPVTRAQADDYLAAMRPELRVDHRTREVAGLLLRQRAPSLALAPFRQLIVQGGVELLPSWAAEMHGRNLLQGTRAMVRGGIDCVARVMRWALSDSSRSARTVDA